MKNHSATQTFALWNGEPRVTGEGTSELAQRGDFSTMHGEICI